MKLSIEACVAFAKNAAIPLRFRVAFLAYGSVRANGHANFKPGELAQILDVRPDVLSRAIANAKDDGLLMYGSNARCLVTPADVVTGWQGHPHDPCPIHEGKRNRAGIGRYGK